MLLKKSIARKALPAGLGKERFGFDDFLVIADFDCRFSSFSLQLSV
jgi:hypothetical protein